MGAVFAPVETGQPDARLSLAHLTGRLRASGAIFDTQGWDDRELPLELTEFGDHLSGFMLDKTWFHNAGLLRNGKLLVVTIGAPADSAAEAPQSYITLQE